MANCAINLLKGIWSFILGSLRIILFFGCLLFILCQVAWVLALFNYSHGEIDLPSSGHSVGPSEFLYGFALLGVAILGCYGSFYKHHPSLKAFSLLTAISSGVLILMILFTINPSDLSEVHEKFVEQMQKQAEKYDWSAGLDSNEEANKQWNSLQKLFCCGLKGPGDWDKYRPSWAPKGSYPRSCCSPKQPQDYSFFENSKDKYCTRDSSTLFEDGCMERIELIEKITILFVIAFIAIQIILCLLSCIVANFNLEGRSSSSTTEDNRGFLPQEYQRFEGSVYVRQPAVNENYCPASGQKTNTAQTMYPNARDVENAPYSVPPPSYGTSP